MVAAFLALFLPFQDILAAGGIHPVAGNGEPAQHLPGIVIGGMQQENPAVLEELRVQCHPEQPILIGCGHCDVAHFSDLTGLRQEDPDLAGDLGKKDPAILKAGQVHGLRHPFRQHLHFESKIGRDIRSRRG